MIDGLVNPMDFIKYPALELSNSILRIPMPAPPLQDANDSIAAPSVEAHQVASPVATEASRPDEGFPGNALGLTECCSADPPFSQ